MINHALALLRNLDGAGVDVNPGGEYVPPGFRAVALPPGLQSVRRQLFGASPDPAYINYMARQYMTLLHAGDYVGHVLALDPRVTYWPFSDAPFSFGVRQQPVAGTRPLHVMGRPAANDTLGRSRFAWRVELAGGSVDVLEQSGLTPAVATPLSFSGGVSQPVELVGSGVALRVDEASEPGSVWMLEAAARPGRDVPWVIRDLRHAGVAAMGELFGTAAAEPFRTFRNLWDRHEQATEQLTGALLALIYRTEALRNP